MCEHCGGKGHDIRRSCPVCDGTGLEKHEIDQLLIVKAGISSGYKQLYEDIGDQFTEDLKIPAGDLELEFICEQETLFDGRLFKRNK